MARRQDRLPHPQSITDLYLSAVLDELRIMNGSKGQTPGVDHDATLGVRGDKLAVPPETESVTVTVKEPEQVPNPVPQPPVELVPTEEEQSPYEGDDEDPVPTLTSTRKPRRKK